MIDWKEVIAFAKTRAFLLVYSNLLPLIIVDYFGWRFWQYLVIFMPINFIINYKLSKKVFKK